MAPNKKKRKPVSNPARSVTTTSLPSKSKAPPLEEADSGANDVPIGEHISHVSQTESLAKGTFEQASGSSAMQDMTPTQLEEYLERAELQSALESMGPKAKKDAHRTTTRLQADRRVLRPQAAYLDTSLLESTVQNGILELAYLEHASPAAQSSRSEKRSVPEIDHVMYIFTLQKAIDELGIPLHADVLQDISSSSVMTVAKDHFRGFEEYLYGLALRFKESSMPEYDSKIVRAHTETTVAQLEGSPEQNLRSENPAQPSRSSSPQKLQAEKARESLSEDSDSDFDPDRLTECYLDMKSRLFRLEQDRPEISEPQVISPNRLRSKLLRVERDVLFDRDEAVKLWHVREIELRKSMSSSGASGRRLQRQVNFSASESPGVRSPISDVMDDGDEDEAVLGSIFEDAEGYGASMEPQNGRTEDEPTTFLHDFGKWTGSPRKVLEEACKSRDPNCKLLYQPTMSGGGSNKHSVRVQFSKGQDGLSTATYQPPHVTFQASSREIELSMSTLATPDYAQSEAYISTVALWVIFAASSKGERPYLRLPSIWREVWDDLSAKKQSEADAEDLCTLISIREMLRRQQPQEPPLLMKTLAINGNKNSAHTRRNHVGPTSQHHDWTLFWRQKTSSPTFHRMLESRRRLPIYNARKQIMDELAASPSRCLLICGETGSGKSTQVPSYLLEHELSSGRDCKVLVTEPRRISAISLARRVSEELGEMKNDVGTTNSLVGYAIRLESKLSSTTRITFATTGVVMRMLEHKDAFHDLSYLIVDEVHERAIDTDFLLIVLRRLLKDRPNLRVILMSATVNAEKFALYFADNSSEVPNPTVPIVNVPGRTFPVEVMYLEDVIEKIHYAPKQSKGTANVDEGDDSPESEREATKTHLTALQKYSNHTRDIVSRFDEYRIDYELIVNTVLLVVNDSYLHVYSQAFLVFLPGLAEIRRMHNLISSSSYFQSGWDIHILHSSISGQEQERAFLVPEQGIRKIVLSTNIAETGVTIPDITTVIDSGKEKVMRFDERRQMSKLTESFISRASSRQRQGRAARVQAGLCIKLYTRDRHDRLMSEQTTPEMLRLSLQEPALRVKLYSLGDIEETLSQALDAPPSKTIHRAISALKEINALTSTEELTSLGLNLVKIPLDIWLGKFIMLGVGFKCLDCVVSIASLMTSRSPFLSSDRFKAAADNARHAFSRGDSDLLLLWNVYSAWRRATATTKAQEFLRRNYLNGQVLSLIEDQKTQLLVALVEAGILQLDEIELSSLRRARITSSRNRHFFNVPFRYNTNSENDIVILSTIASAFYPKLLRREGKGWRNIATNQNVSIAPVSILRTAPPDQMPKWLSFYQTTQAKSKNVLVHDASPVGDLAMALFLGDAEFKIFAGVITIDNNRVRFAVKDLRMMVALKILRTKIQALIAHAMHSSKKPLSESMQKWAEIWQHLMEEWANTRDKKRRVGD